MIIDMVPVFLGNKPDGSSDILQRTSLITHDDHAIKLIHARGLETGSPRQFDARVSQQSGAPFTALSLVGARLVRLPGSLHPPSLEV